METQELFYVEYSVHPRLQEVLLTIIVVTG